MPKALHRRAITVRSSLYLDDEETIKIKVNDCVLIKAQGGCAPYIGRILKIQQLSSDPHDIDCIVSWFYRPEEARGGRKVFYGSKEVFSSDHVDHAHKSTMLAPCKVHKLDEYERLDSIGDTDYFERFKYFAHLQTFEPDRVPVFCFCELPYNPDHLMLCCDECQEWYHPECLNLPQDAVERFANDIPFYCPDCLSNAGMNHVHGDDCFVQHACSNPVHEHDEPSLLLPTSEAVQTVVYQTQVVSSLQQLQHQWHGSDAGTLHLDRWLSKQASFQHQLPQQHMIHQQQSQCYPSSS